MRSLIRILLLIPSIYLVAMPVYYCHTFNSKPCSGIRITVADSSDYHFVTKRDIQNTISTGNGNLVGKPVGEINVAEVERTMNKYRELRVAEAYISVDGVLHVYADQRTPIMRVIPGNGGDYYIDVEGVVVRKRNLYSPRLHIVGGNVNISAAMLNGVSVLDTANRNSILRDIFYLVGFINENDFWSAQIDQIFVDRNDEIDLIPRVGNHTIHLGTAENFRDKFRNLEVFYSKVLPEIGWNRYSVINLAFRDQIVCKRR
ncbi:MAG: hypothetical protein WCE64_00970 [Bacteroidales bacterium]